MGAQLAGKSNGRGKRRSYSQLSEINVTPFVDVMLVLLIVFMVAAPLMTVGVAIDLPQTQAQQMNTERQPITISVTELGAIFIGQEPIAEADLVARVAAAAVNGTEDRIYVRGDTTANYGAVMRVMGVLSGSGYSRIGLITDQEPQVP